MHKVCSQLVWTSQTICYTPEKSAPHEDRTAVTRILQPRLARYAIRALGIRGRIHCIYICTDNIVLVSVYCLSYPKETFTHMSIFPTLSSHICPPTLYLLICPIRKFKNRKRKKRKLKKKSCFEGPNPAPKDLLRSKKNIAPAGFEPCSKRSAFPQEQKKA
jgi:hypothetical protein